MVGPDAALPKEGGDISSPVSPSPVSDVSAPNSASNVAAKKQLRVE
jgi:hypothetical protein